MIAATLIIVVAIILLIATASFWVNWWWYGSIGYRSILVTRYVSTAASFIIGALLTGLLVGGNLYLAFRWSKNVAVPGRVEQYAARALAWLAIVGTAALSIIVGLLAADRWQTWQLAIRGGHFGISDPIFDHDAGFYIFRLPALTLIHSWAIALVIITGLACAAIYAIRFGVRFRTVRTAPHAMKVHLLSLVGVLLLLFGLRYLLQNYELLYSSRGAAYGAGYTDVNVQRWANYALALISFAIGAILVANAFVTRVRPLLIAVGAWFATALILGIALPAMVQQALVEPSELRRESPYISNNIEMTRAAYALDVVEERQQTGAVPLEAADLEGYPETLQNIRLWDYRVVQTTYQQLQSFVPYFVFVDIDVDRYQVEGSPQQVVISARELDIDGLAPGARTWTNRHLVYTHGYGAAASPVSQVSTQGLPAFVVDEIPPTGTGPYEIVRPEIYFGELEGTWVAVNTNQPEFSGDIADEPGEDLTYEYEGAGRGSISLDSYIKRLLTSVHLRDRNLLLSDEITDESRILMRRQITDRIEAVAPFLRLDPDPYLVIAEGRLFWLVDAYTTTDRFPYATPTSGLNYLRNSVKVLVDAYNGDVTLYRTATPDPIADAYSRMYGDILTPISEAPPAIAEHFRYPEMMFDIQSEIYTEYHVTDPADFYNGEDRWAIPEEQGSGPTQQIEPYYVTMTLPDESEPSFALIRPFIPGGGSNRQNMTAWMGGRNESDGSNRLVVYRYPRQVTVFGPSQVSARIDQEPDISAQISLWNQSGSSVIRGNLLVIPVGDSVLYVQPLYLEATESQGALPELRRVIAASSDRVVMEPTLEAALAALTGGDPDTAAPPPDVPDDAVEVPAPDAGATIEQLAERAVLVFEAGQEALAAGDWTAYGQAQAELELILFQMAEHSGADVPAAQATPAPTNTDP